MNTQNETEYKNKLLMKIEKAIRDAVEVYGEIDTKDDDDIILLAVHIVNEVME